MSTTEPRIRYCRTADGISIAFWSIGQGDLVIDAGHPPTHCEIEWRMPPIRAWYERFCGAAPVRPLRQPGERSFHARDR